MTMSEQIFIPRPGMPHAPTREGFVPFTPDGRGGMGKPKGGFWTSTLATSNEDGWESWCRSERMDWLADVGYVLTPVEDLNVFVVDGPEAFRELVERYGFNPYVNMSKTVGGVMQRRTVPAILDDRREINWEAFVADGYDGIRVTDPYHPEIRHGVVMAFYGWDCESTWWSRWAFVEDEGRPIPITPVDMRSPWDDDEEYDDEIVIGESAIMVPTGESPQAPEEET